jgi:hypothetical protein
MKWLIPVFALVLVPAASCKKQHAGSKSKNDSSSKIELTASDISILVPLKPFPAKDRVFEIEGTGICNAPALDHDPKAPIMSQKDFLSMMGSAFLQTAILAGSEYREGTPSDLEFESKLAKVIDGKGTPEQLQADFAQLCKDRAGHTAIMGLKDLSSKEVLKMDSSVGRPLALSRSFPDSICQYHDWRVVGLRFDPCVNRAQFPNLLTLDALPESANGCVAETRLVIQPLLCQGGTAGKVCNDPSLPLDGHDFAFHVLFEHKIDPAFVQEMRELASISRQRAKTPWSVADVNDPRLLLPHPGLREEMNQCDGPVATKFKTILSKYVNRERLTGATWMATADGPSSWTFGSVGILDKSDDRMKWGDPFATENFSLTLLDNQDFPFDVDLKDSSPPNHVAPFFVDALAPIPNLAKAKVPVLNDMLNPLRVSQLAVRAPSPPSPGHDSSATRVSSSCVSCHLAQMTIKATVSNNDIDMAYSEGGYASQEFKSLPPVWPLFEKEKGSMANLRNFGYASSVKVGVSRRAIYETDDTLSVVKKFYP